MAEGSSTPEEAVPTPPKTRSDSVRFNEFGEIEGLPSKNKATSNELVDPDDLPQYQGTTPRTNLERLRGQLVNSTPVEISPTGEIKQGSVSPTLQTKP